MNQIVRFDTNSLNRALIGFDDLFNNFEQRFANQLNTAYPPYNILKYDDDTYEIEIAVTGFEKDEITVEIDQHNLVVRGSKKGEGKEDSNYIYRGLANRDFTRFWELGEYIEVNEGRIKNGVLTIGLKRVVPEALKPRVLKLKSE